MSEQPGAAAPVDEERVAERVRANVRAHLTLSDFIQRYALVFVWGIVVLIFSVLPSTSSTFPTVANFAGIFGTQAVILICALALLVPLVAGDYDLSVAANVMLSAMTVAILNAQHHWNIYLCIAIALAVGAAVGAINGGIVILLGIDPFIVTLGTSTFITGVVLWVSASNTVSGVSQSLITPVVIDRWPGFFPIPLMFWYGVALTAILWFVFEFTRLGPDGKVPSRPATATRTSPATRSSGASSSTRPAGTLPAASDVTRGARKGPSALRAAPRPTPGAGAPRRAARP